MIDYVKILIISPNIECLLSNPKLDFNTEKKIKKGEKNLIKLEADYHFCKIIIYENGTVFFQGSIHKLWNSLNNYNAPNYKKDRYRGFNGNLFTLKNVNGVIRHLMALFDCEPQQMIIKSVEFGININLNFSPNKFLTGLLFHKGNPFDSRFKRTYFEVTHQQFRIKIYNKSLQYQMTDNVLRFEIKYTKMPILKAKGIFTMQDINHTSLSAVSEILSNRFDEIVYFDKTITKNKLNKNEKELVKKYPNINYWLDELKPNHRDRHKKRLKKLILNHSSNLHQQIKEDLLKKCVIINQVEKDNFV